MSAPLLAAVKAYVAALDAYKIECLAADRTRRLKALRALTDAELVLRAQGSAAERGVIRCGTCGGCNWTCGEGS